MTTPSNPSGGTEISDAQILRSRFWRKYMRMTRAGVPVLKALRIIQKEAADKRLAETVHEMRSDIEKGMPMSRAMSKAGDVFSLSEVEMVKTAERRGAWDEVLQELADGLIDGSFDVPSEG